MIKTLFCTNISPVYNYNKGDFAALRESLKLLPLTDIVLCEDDIDIAWSKWCDTFLAAVDTSFQVNKPPDHRLHPTSQAR